MEPPHFVETACAKVNLSLRVLGRRADGYHELESLVAFAEFGDIVTMTMDDRSVRRDLVVTGPFAGAIDGPNLLQRTLDAITARVPSARTGSIRLEKQLPVAAGLGGGSADAAALIRLVRRANPGLISDTTAHEIGCGIGADVPVCLGLRPAIMRGIGHRLEPLPAPLPEAALVLVNPRLPLATATVYKALGAAPLTNPPAAIAPAPSFATVRDLAAHINQEGNDLERPAIELCPVIGNVISELAASPRALAARMSGSGATCFALYASLADAQAAAAHLTERYPQWWIVATQLVRCCN